MNPDELLNALATIEAFRGDGYRAGQDSLLPLVKELREALADELNKNGLSWERHVHLFARADKALEEEKR